MSITNKKPLMGAYDAVFGTITKPAPATQPTTPTAPATAPATPTAATATSYKRPATTSNSNLSGIYKDVFAQQTAQVNRQNAQRAGAATRTAQEQAAIGGYNPAQTQRAMELSTAGANAANLESQQDLLNTGTSLAQQQKSDDLANAYKMIELGQNTNSPELTSAAVGSLVSGAPADYSTVFGADGNLKTMSDFDKTLASQKELEQKLNDPTLTAEQKSLIQSQWDTTQSASKAASATANTQNVATAIKTGTKALSDFTDTQISDAYRANDTIKTQMLATAPDAGKGGLQMYTAMKDVGKGGIVSLNGVPVRVISDFTQRGTDKNGSPIYRATVYNFETGMREEVKY